MGLDIFIPDTLTNQEAANVLKHHLKQTQFPRCNGKTQQLYIWLAANLKAIELLEKTPDDI